MVHCSSVPAVIRHSGLWSDSYRHRRLAQLQPATLMADAAWGGEAAHSSPNARLSRFGSFGAVRSGCAWPCSIDLPPDCSMAATRATRWWKMILPAHAGLLLCVLAIVTVVVVRDAVDALQSLGGEGERRALISYHPSGEAHFTGELSLVIAEGLKAARHSVDRATLTGITPDPPKGHHLLDVVSNTSFWTPDLPTLSDLESVLRLAHLLSPCDDGGPAVLPDRRPRAAVFHV